MLLPKPASNSRALRRLRPVPVTPEKRAELESASGIADPGFLDALAEIASMAATLHIDDPDPGLREQKDKLDNLALAVDSVERAYRAVQASRHTRVLDGSTRQTMWDVARIGQEARAAHTALTGDDYRKTGGRPSEALGLWLAMRVSREMWIAGHRRRRSPDLRMIETLAIMLEVVDDGVDPDALWDRARNRLREAFKLAR